MKFGSALATLALATLITPVPALAAKDEKLAKCSGTKKRPANPYGTVLPTVPDRSSPAASIAPGGAGVPRGTPASQPAASSAAPTNLFPPEGGSQGSRKPDVSQAVTVPAIGSLTAGAGPTAALSPTFASC